MAKGKIIGTARFTGGKEGKVEYQGKSYSTFKEAYKSTKKKRFGLF